MIQVADYELRVKLYVSEFTHFVHEIAPPRRAYCRLITYETMSLYIAN
ncbi:hypothetical protein ES705_12014 [subsurface metagenome]